MTLSFPVSQKNPPITNTSLQKTPPCLVTPQALQQISPSPFRRSSSLEVRSPRQGAPSQREPISYIDIKSSREASARLQVSLFNPKKQPALNLYTQMKEFSCRYLTEKSVSAEQEILRIRTETRTATASFFLDKAHDYISTYGWLDPEVMKLITLYNQALSSSDLENKVSYEFVPMIETVNVLKASISEDGSNRTEAMTAICDHILSLLLPKEQNEQTSSPLFREALIPQTKQIQSLITLHQESNRLPVEIQELYHKAQPAILALYKNRIQETARLALQGKPPTQDPSPLKILRDILQKTIDSIESSCDTSELTILLSISAFLKQELHSSHQEELVFSPTTEELCSPSDREHKNRAFALPHEREVFALCHRIQTLHKQDALNINRIDLGELLLLKHLLNLCASQEQKLSFEEKIDSLDIHILYNFILKCTPEALQTLSLEEQKSFLQAWQQEEHANTSSFTKTNTSRSFPASPIYYN